VEPRTPLLDALDRAAQARKDADLLESLLDAEDTWLVPVWRNQALIDAADETRPLLVRAARAPALVESALELAWLGRLGNSACFALDISDAERPLELLPRGGPGRFADLRLAGNFMHPRDFGVLAFARGILHWHRQHRFCGRCAAATRAREGGHVRECVSCRTKHFPRTDPAVMVLAISGDSCLLARQPGFPAGMYSALAGFVEPGESVEECAVRETGEEVGVKISDLRYFRSQSWPFPQSLMLGFFARAESRELLLDHDELESARWVTREELREPRGFSYPPRVSLAHAMIRYFMEHGA
jgi:NAD+ diphosphatase